MAKDDSLFEYKKIDPDFLRKQFQGKAEAMMHDFLKFKNDNVVNPTDEGQALENILLNFLVSYLPGKCGAAKGYVMNTEGKISSQQDIVIYDRLNIVFLENTDGFKVFPVEFVYATVEVKSYLTKSELNKARKNIKSIKHLSGLLLKLDLETGDILDAELEGAIVFCSIFSFGTKVSLETVTNNLRDDGGGVDFICVLNEGHIAYTTKLDESEIGEDGTVFLNISTTTTPNYDEDKLIFFQKKNDTNIGYSLFWWFMEILSHVEEQENGRVKFSILNYLKSPDGESTHSISWEDTRTE